jgi:hypothetical protein
VRYITPPDLDATRVPHGKGHHDERCDGRFDGKPMLRDGDYDAKKRPEADHRRRDT